VVILLTGASGFLGRSVAAALERAGHEVIRASRHAGTSGYAGSAAHVAVDYTKDFAASTWAARLAGVDAVINAVGIFRERPGKTFEAIHVQAPRALFAACASAGIRVVQISALGADAGAVSRYHSSKREADDFLLAASPASVVAKPSIVFGAGGASAALFTTLASMPVVALPGAGDQRIQPIHVDDFTDAIVKLATSNESAGLRVPLVGREPVSLRDFLAELRRSMGLRPATFIPVPWGMATAGARLAGLHPRSLVDVDSLGMLARGNTADASATRQLLGRPPLAVRQFIAPAAASAARASARLGWLLPVLRLSVAVVWIVSGLVSLGLYPVEQSYALLARAGLAGPFAALALYGAAALDLFFGVATLAMASRRLLWLAQGAVIVAYTLIITLSLPEYWLHPFGPVLKNLPMLAGIWMLYELEER
jgi:uncharacterized protein YbjT (DUF2867 family)